MCSVRWGRHTVHSTGRRLSHPLNATHSGLRVSHPLRLLFFGDSRAPTSSHSAPSTVRPPVAFGRMGPITRSKPSPPSCPYAQRLSNPPSSSFPLRVFQLFLLLYNITHISQCFETTLVPRIETIAVSVPYETLACALRFRVETLAAARPSSIRPFVLAARAQRSLAVLHTTPPFQICRYGHADTDVIWNSPKPPSAPLQISSRRFTNLSPLETTPLGATLVEIYLRQTRNHPLLLHHFLPKLSTYMMCIIAL